MLLQLTVKVSKDLNIEMSYVRSQSAMNESPPPWTLKTKKKHMQFFYISFWFFI